MAKMWGSLLLAFLVVVGLPPSAGATVELWTAHPDAALSSDGSDDVVAVLDGIVDWVLKTAWGVVNCYLHQNC